MNPLFKALGGGAMPHSSSRDPSAAITIAATVRNCGDSTCAFNSRDIVCFGTPDAVSHCATVHCFLSFRLCKYAVICAFSPINSHMLLILSSMTRIVPPMGRVFPGWALRDAALCG